jgi:hypothetical protein
MVVENIMDVFKSCEKCVVRFASLALDRNWGWIRDGTDCMSVSTVRID